MRKKLEKTPYALNMNKNTGRTTSRTTSRRLHLSALNSAATRAVNQHMTSTVEPLETRRLLTTIYVDSASPGTTQNGTSWSTAYLTLPQGLSAAATAGSATIEVGAGTYRTTTGSDRTATFQLLNNVAIYGGYAGYGTSNPDTRNPTATPTILSGDLGVIGNTSDNTYHIVTASGTNSTAILDGVTITAGNANGTGNFNSGAGIFDSGGSPTLNNLTITSSTANYSGGGIFISNSSSPAITNSTFTNDSAKSRGGAIGIANSSSPTISASTFTRNTVLGVSQVYGGAIEIGATSTASITNSSFLGNSVTATSTSPIYPTAGGAVDCEGTSTLITDSVFAGNFVSAYDFADGGAISAFSTTVTIEGATITGNTAITTSGTNSIGGGIFLNNPSSTISNSVLWKNTAKFGADIDQAAGGTGTTTISYSDVGVSSGTTNGLAVVSVDPLFTTAPSAGADGVWGTADDNYGNLTPQYLSPIINIGSNANVPSGITADIAGSTRIQGGIVDLGAYETPVTSWISTTSGYWDVATNWSGGVVPSSTTPVAINTTASAVITVRSGSATAASVISNNAINLSGGTLAVAGTLQVNNTLSLNGGTLSTATIVAGTGSASFSLTSAGSVLSGVTLNLPLTVNHPLNVTSGLTLNSTLTLNSSSGTASLTFQNSQTLSGTGNLLFAGNFANDSLDIQSVSSAAATLTVASGITISLASPTFMGNTSSATIAGVTGNGQETLVNQGNIIAGVAGYGFNIGSGLAGVTNNGTLNISAGFINISPKTLGTTSTGIIAVGPTGAMNITGAFTQTAAGAFDEVLGGSAAGQYGVATITGATSIGGTLNISEANGYIPVNGSTFSILSYPAAAGSFSTITGQVINSSTAINVIYSGTGVTLSAANYQKALWVNPAGGYWDVPTNWSGGILPAAGDSVVINSTTGPVIFRSGAATVAGVISSAPFNLSGGILTVTGTVQVNNAFQLNGGTLVSATVQPGTGGQGINVTGTSSIFNTVTVNSNLNVYQTSGATLTIYNGLVLNGIADIGNSAGTAYGYLYFGDGSHASGSLTGTGSVIFGTNSSSQSVIWQNSTLSGANGILTIGSGITIGGAIGQIDTFSATLGIVNNGTIVANSSNSTIIADLSTNNGVINASAGYFFNIPPTSVTTFTNNGTIGVGPTGSVGIDSNLIEASGATFNVVLGGLTSYGVATIDGKATLAGTLNITESGGYLPANGSSFSILSYNSASGQFATINGLNPSSSIQLIPSYGATALALNATPFREGVWINSAGGYWDVPSNWSGGILPQGGDNVTISVANGPVIFRSGTASVASITSSSPFNLSGGTLTVIGSVQINNSFIISGGTLVGATVQPGSGGQGLTDSISGGGVLVGVTMNANLSIFAAGAADLMIDNNLVLNGTLFLGDSTGSTYGYIDFGDGSHASGSLTGTGSVVFGTDTTNRSALISYSSLSGANGVLTIGPGITIDGAAGYLVDEFYNNSIINQGTILSNQTNSNIIAAVTTNSGILNASAGSLSITTSPTSTTFTNSGTIYANSGAALSISNNGFTQTNTGSLDLVLTGPSSYGAVSGISKATLAGALNIIDSGGYVPANGSVFSILSYTSESGQFSTVTGLNINSTTTLSVAYGSTSTTLTTNSVPEGTWINPAGGYWDVASNWAGGILPKAGDNVIVNATNGPVIFRSGTATVASITAASPFNLSGGTLTVTGNMQVNNTFIISGGTLAGATVLPGTGGQGLTASGGTAYLSGVTLNANLDMTGSNDLVLTIYNGLTVNGTASLGNSAGTTYGELLFGDSNHSAGTLAGTGFVRFGGSTNNLLENNSNLTGSAILTIGAGISISGENGAVISSYSKDGIVNQGLISSNVTGGTLFIGGTSASQGNDSTSNFSNAAPGVLAISSGGSIVIGGVIQGANVGTLSHSGSGTFSLYGTINLSGGTLTLNSSTGSLIVDQGGLIEKGTINDGQLASGGAVIIGGDNDGGILSGITLNGDLDLTEVSYAQMTVNGGFALNGTVYIGNSGGTTIGCSLSFGLNGGAPGSFTGSGTVLFGSTQQDRPDNSVENTSDVSGANGVLTIGAGITIGGRQGQILSLGYDSELGGAIVNQGVIESNVSGGSISVGYDFADQTNPAAFTNTGTLSLSNGGSMSLGGSLTSTGLGTIIRSGSGALNLDGNLNLATGTINLNTTTGSLVLAGGIIQNGTIYSGTESGGGALLTGDGGYLSKITLDGDLDLATEPYGGNTTVYGGLVLNGTAYIGSSSGSTSGSLVFGDGTDSAGTLSGDATVVFGANSSNGILNESGATGGLTLTIASSVLIHGNSGVVAGEAGNNIINQGTIRCDISGGQILVGGSPADVGLYGQVQLNFTNSGALSLTNGGSIILAGIMTSLGTVSHSGSGSLALLGVLNLSGGTLTLNSSTGSLALDGGTLENGTVNDGTVASSGPVLQGAPDSPASGSADGSFLIGITINGDLDLKTFAGAEVTGCNGLVLNGTVYIGNASAANSDELSFGTDDVETSTPSAAGTFSGNATVVFGASINNRLADWSTAAGSASVLTIAPTVTIHGNMGTIDPTLGNIINQGVIISDTSGGNIEVDDNGAFTNSGVITATAGAVTIDPVSTFTNSGTLNASGGSISIAPFAGGFINSGMLLAGPAGKISITGAFTQSTGASVNAVLGGNTNGSYGNVSVNGAATLAGTLNITESGGFVPSNGSSFSVLTYTSETGQFSTINGLQVNSSTLLTPAYNAKSLTLTTSVSQEGLWINPAGGYWDVASNWSGGILPKAGDNVIINTSGGALVTFRSGSATVGSVLSNAPLNLSGGTLTVSGTLQVNNTFTIAGGTLANATVQPGAGGQGVTATTAGGILYGVTMNANLNISASGGADLTVDNNLVLNGTVYLGDSTGSTYGFLDFGDGTDASGSLLGNGSVVFGADTANRSALINYSGLSGANAVLTIGPGITISGTSGVLDDADSSDFIVNQGTIQVNQSSSSIVAALSSNTGSIFVTAGSLTIQFPTNNSTFTNSGSIYSNPATSTFSVQSAYAQTTTGNLNYILSGASHFAAINISGNATLAGALNVEDYSGYVPPNGTVFTALNYASETGTFSTVTGLTINSTTSLSLAYGPTSTNLTSATVQEGTWINPAGGYWDVASNWAGGILPQAGDNVVINTTGNAPVTFRSGTATVAGITSNAPLNLSGGTLTVTGDLQVNNTFNLNGGTLQNATIQPGSGGSVNLTASSTLTGITLDVNLTNPGYILTIKGGLTLANGSSLIVNSTGPANGSLGYERVLFSGTQTVGGNGSIILGDTYYGPQIYAQGDGGSNPATLTIGAGISVTQLAGSTIAPVISGYYTNDGILNLGTIIASIPGVPITSPVGEGTFINNGLIEAINGGTLEIDTFTGNVGSVLISGTGSTLKIGGTNYTNNMGITVPAGASLYVGGTLTTAQLGTINAPSGSVYITGTINNSGSTLALGATTGSWILYAGNISGGAISTTGSASLTISAANSILSGVTIAGTVVDPSSSMFVINGLTLNSGASFVIGSDQPGYGATASVQFEGTQTISGNGTISFGGGSNSRELTVEGTSFLNPATLTIASGVTIQESAGLGGTAYLDSDFNGDNIVNLGTINANVNNSSASLQISATLNNSGIVESTGGSVIITSLLNNLGTVNSSAGSITINSNIVSSGTVSVGPAGSITVAGNYTQTGAGTFDAVLGGTALNSYGSLHTTGSATVAGTLNILESGGFTPQPGNVFAIIKSASESGTFSTVNGTNINNQALIQPAYQSSGVSLTTTSVASPDLTVTNLSTNPTSLQSGQNITISWKDSNIGNAAAIGSWSDHVKIVNTTTGQTLLDTTSPLTGQNISAGSSSLQMVNFTLPAGNAGAGNLQITVVTDSGQTIFESNSTGTAYSNNTATLNITSALAPYPDLTVQGLAITPPSPQSGDAITINWYDANIGNAPATGTWTDQVTVVNNTTGQTLYSAALPQAGNNIGGSSSAARSANFNLPQGSPGVGQLTVTVTVDSLNQVAEYNAGGTAESNNTASINATSTISQYPDLVVTGLQLEPSNPVSSEAVTVNWADANIGIAPANGGWYDQITVVNTTTGATLYSGSQYEAGNSLNPGGTTPRSVGFNLPDGNAGVGQLLITVMVDSTNTVFEYNATGTAETNNTSTANATSTLALYPDLVVSGVGLSLSAPQSGQTLSVNWTDANTGSGPATGTWYDHVVVVNTTTGQTVFNDTPQFTGNNLQPNGAIARSDQFTLPNGSAGAGNLSISVTVDSNGNVYESNSTGTAESNNTTTATAVSTLAAYPDLTVTGLALSDPAPTSGETLSINWNDTNSSPNPAVGNWTDLVTVVNKTTGQTLYTNQVSFASNNLSGGNSIARSVPVTLPNGSPGVGLLSVSVTVNSTGSIYEYNSSGTAGSNNTQTITATSTLGLSPDLGVTVVTPAPSISGRGISISFTVTNNGAAAANGSWTDSITLIPVGGGTSYNLGTLVNPESLAVNQSYTRTANFTLPDNISGQYQISVTTNATDSLYETSFGNNTATSSAFAIALAPYADLIVTKVNVPATVTAGQLLNISWTVENQGTGGTTATAWYDEVYISLNPNGIDGSAIALGSVQNPTYLNPGESYPSSFSAALSTSLPQGTYYAYVHTNITGSQPESVYSNNNITKSATGVQVQPISNPALFDVTSVIVSPGSGVYEGQSVLVTYTVKNTGGQPITGTWYDGLALSPGQAYDAAGAEALQIITVANQSPLAPGASYTESAIVTLPTNLSGNLYVVVDPDHEETASQTGGVGSGDVPKTDNAGAVIVSAPLKPKLDVTSVAAPTTVTANSALHVTWQVSNDGYAPTGASAWTDAVYLSTSTTLDGSAILLGTVDHTGSLDTVSNKSYSSSSLFTVPYRLSGTYYVFVQTDIYSQVAADDSSANRVGMQAAAITVAPYVDNGSGGGGGSTSIPVADLVTSKVTTSLTAASGTPITVSWQVANTGPDTTNSAQWIDHVYLSDHAGISGSNVTAIAQITHQGALAVNSSYIGTTSFVLPNNISGTYYIVVVSDPEENVYEGSNDPSAKTAYTSFTITARPLPALTVNSVNAVTTVVAGSSVKVSWTVINNSAGGTLTSESSWADSVYISSSSQFDSTAVLAATVYRNGGLAAGASYNASANISIPLTTTGTQYIFVLTDSGHAVYEGATRPAGGTGTASLNVTAAPFSILSVGSITAPASDYAGQPITIGWTVSNSHSASTTNLSSWTDTVYLSSDQFIDQTSIALGNYTHNGALAAGGSYNGALTVTLPSYLSGPYYILVVTDSQHQVYQAGNTAGNTGVGAGTVNVVLPQLAELSDTIVSIPSTGITGMPASPAITWTVTNTGSSDAVGSWVDSAYLSSSPSFNSNALLIAQVTHNGGLAKGASYNGSSGSALLPAEIVPGMYYVIVRADSQGVVRETDRSGNQAVSTDRISMDVQALTLGTPVSSTLAPGQNIYYRVTVPAGESLNLTSIFGKAYGAEFYVSYGKPPTPSSYDHVYSNDSDLNQAISIPNTTAGNYYILLARSAQATGNSTYTLSASIPSFGISSINLTHGSNLGSVTLTVNGAEFTPSTNIQLSDGESNPINPTRVIWFDASTLWVTFNLTGLSTGVYSLLASNGGTSGSALSDAFTVDNSAPGNLQVSAAAPGVIRAGTAGQVTFYYSNTGNTDIPAPLLLLTANGAMLQLDDGSLTGSQQILGINTTGPAGTLPPGYSGDVTYTFQLNAYQPGGANTYGFDIAALGSTTSTVDWASLEASSKPPQISAAAWSAIFQNLLLSTGTTLGDFQGMLGDTATYLSQLNDYTNSISTLLGFKYTQANDGLLPTPLQSATDISVPAPGLALQFSRSYYSTISARNQTGMLGVGWLTPWDIKLIPGLNSIETVDLTTAQIEFDPSTSGGFTGPDGAGTLNLVGGNYVYTDASGTSYGFTSSGAVSFVRDKNGNQITASFSNSRIMTLTQSDGAYLNFLYTPSGYVSSVTASDGDTVSYTYDLTGQYLMSVTTASGTTSYTYEKSPNIAVNNALGSVTLPGQAAINYGYDSQGRLTGSTSALPSEKVGYVYDNNGGITIQDAQQNSTQYLLTQSLKPGRIVDGDGNVTEIDYGSDGNPTDETLPGGLVYHFQYNSAGQIIGTSDPLGNTQSFTYQTGTNFLSSYTNGLGATTSYSFDGAGNVTGVIDPGRVAQTYSYNSLGEMTGSTDSRQQATTYTYNAAGQILREQFSDGTFEIFTYDSRGDVTSVNNSTGVTSYTYNSLNQLSSETDPSGQSIYVSYNADGQRKEYDFVTNHQVTNSLFFNYSSAGQLTSVGFDSNTILVSYTYDGSGRLQSQTDENGQYTTYQYDSAGNLIQLINQRSLEEPIGSEFTYTYDALNRISTETSIDGTWGYTYDSDSQLISAIFTPSFGSQVPAQNLSFTYDSAGNRLQTINNGVVVGYTTNSAGEYTQVGGTSYRYDADGNLIFDGLYNYTYNSQNQLTTVIGNGTTTSYTYNANGQVIAQTVNGVTTDYLLDPITGQRINEYSLTNGVVNITATDLSGLSLVSRSVGANNYTYSYDGTGSTVGLENNVATVVQSYAYDPFGNQLESTSIANPFMYLGQSEAVTGANGVVVNGSTALNTLLGRTQSASNSLTSGSLNPYSFLNSAWSSRSNAAGADFSNLTTQVISGISARLQPQAFGIAGPLFASTGQLASSSFGSSVAGNLSSSLTSIQPNIAATPGAVGTGGGGTKHGGGGNSSTLPPPSTLSGATLANSSTGTTVVGSRAFTGIRGNSDGYQSVSLDPNSISGPLGFGPAQTIGTSSSQIFQIDFENLPTATAPADVVTVTTQLDAGWDWHTFQLHSIEFDHNVITVPDGLSFFSTIYDERAIGINLLVEITAGLNPENGVVTWRFAGIDPNTGVAPTDPTIGVLPPDDASDDGQGELTYSIRALASDPSGTVVNSAATVIFDTQAPIDTNTWTNTVNTSQISTTLSVTTPTTPVQQVTLTWSATETSGGAGIAAYTVYASTDGGVTYQPFITGTQLTSANYVVVPGRTYSFYVIAFDNVGESSSIPAQPQATITVPANVFSAASIFYNNSFYNGYNSTATAADDNAIATDKTPLLPGQTATFANYTSYSKGINGIMIDIAGILSNINAGDFILTMGNSSTTSQWVSAPAPSSISLRSINNGSLNRVTLIWADNAIQNIWLSITILANADTGLAAPVTFYFGNAIGESGNSPTDATVNTSDSLGARGHQSAGVPITDVWDYNRDGKVDASDVTIAQQHGTAGAAALQLITPPGPSPVSKSKLHSTSGVGVVDQSTLASWTGSSAVSDLSSSTDNSAPASGTVGTDQNPADQSAGSGSISAAAPEFSQTTTVTAAPAAQPVNTGFAVFQTPLQKKEIHSSVLIQDVLDDADDILHL